MKLYRHFSKDGRLLYVGITRNPILRLGQHQKAAPWEEQIKTITIESFRNDAAARRAEAKAIHYEKPVHNVLRPRLTPRRPASRPLPATAYADWPAIDQSPDRPVKDIVSEHSERTRAGLAAFDMTDIARRTGIAYTTLWRIREGRVQPGEGTIDAVELALNYLREKGRCDG